MKTISKMAPIPCIILIIIKSKVLVMKIFLVEIRIVIALLKVVLITKKIIMMKEIKNPILEKGKSLFILKCP